MTSLLVSWKQLPKQGCVPCARSSHSLNIVNNKAYVFGGEEVPRVPIDNSIFSYDFSTEKWSKCDITGQPPCPRIGHASAVVGKWIYIFGGRTTQDLDTSLNDMHRFDTEHQSWEEVKYKSDHHVPVPRNYHAMTSSGNTIYVFGGCFGMTRMNDVHAYDIVSGQWSALPVFDAITPRGGPGFVFVADSLYVVAGFCGYELGDMFKYHLPSESWSQIKALPNIPNISVFGMASVGDYIILFGGEVSPSDSGHAGVGQHTNDTYYYDVTNPESGWRKAHVEGVSPCEMGWHAACATDNSLCIHGGNAADNSRLDDLYVMTILN